MADIRIKELTELTELTDNDYFVVDNSASGGETKKYKATRIKDILDSIPELVAEFEPNVYYERDALVAHEGKVYYHNASGASYTEFPTGYQFMQTDLTSLLKRLGFGISIQHNSSFTYNKGDYCMEDYILYRCLKDNVTGSWRSTDWEQASLGYDLSHIYKPRLDEHDEQINSALAIGSASGDIASFSDGSTLPMSKLEIGIEAVQDLHGYDHPWVGGAGKNLLNLQDIKCGDGEPRVTNKIVNIAVNSGKYTISWQIEGNAQGNVQIKCDGSAYIGVNNGDSFDVTNTIDNLYFFIGQDSYDQGKYCVFKNIQIEKGSTATEYEPYSNICPISGHTEANVTVADDITNKSFFDGLMNGTYGVVDLGSLDWTNITGNLFGTTSVSNVKYTSVNTQIGNATASKYILHAGSGMSGSDAVNCLAIDTNKISVNTGSQSVTPTGYLIYELATPTTPTVTPSEINELYEEFGINGQTYNIQFRNGDNPLTVYGGTLDVVSGELTVDRVSVDLGTLGWSYNSPTQVFWSGYLSNIKLGGKLVSSQYKQSDSARIELLNDGEMWNKNYAYSPTNIVIKDTRYTSASDFETAMNGVQLVYELAIPQTYQLTPTQVKSLLGSNNVWCDTGEIIDCEYKRDATAIINSLIARIEALENQ